MDIPLDPKPRSRRRAALVTGSVLVLALITAGLLRLEPAAPAVDYASVRIDTVREGPMVRQVTAPGTLVPEKIRYISAATAGRVERLPVQPGVAVEPRTELLLLGNPEVQLQALEAQRQFAAAQANLANLRATLENQRLNHQGEVARLRSEATDAERQVTAERELEALGMIPTLQLQRSEDRAAQLAERLEIELRRLEFIDASFEAQLSAQRTELDRLSSLVQVQQAYVESLTVRAGAKGVLREIPLQEGQWVNPRTRLAVVVEPGRLKGELRVPETQTRELAVGQPATIDTRNGLVPGHVTRIDPAVQNGTVTVDVALDGGLPRGGRPDLSISGTVEIERLENVVFTGRPAYAQEGATASLFVLEPGGERAHRMRVRFGRTSVNTVEIVSGLAPGDVVILSDLSQWDSSSSLRLR